MAGLPSRLERLSLPLLFVAALVIIVALASNLAQLSEDPPVVPGVRNRPEPGDVTGGRVLLAVLVWAFAAALLLVGLGIYLWARRGTGRPGWEMVGTLVGAAVGVSMIMLVLFWPQIAGEVPPAIDATTAQTEPANDGSGMPLAQVVRAVPILAAFIALAAVVFALAGLSTGRPTGRALPSAEPPSTGERRAAASRAVRRTIEDLEAGLDPREVILRCYASLMVVLTQRGVEGMDPLTAREVQRMALAQFPLTVDDIEALTSVFEEARYSEHPMWPESRDRAVRAFSSLRTALEG